MSTPSSSTTPCLFAIRLVSIDVESIKPTDLDLKSSPLTGRKLRNVPIIRIFGATPRGQKALLHLHGVYRYFLVPFDGERTDGKSLKRLAEELEEEMRRAGGERFAGDHALVLDLSIEPLTPFYGYHEEARPFLKVTMVTPGHVDLAARLFSRGFAHRRPRQPHEAHINHLLQFKVDHNCLGMAFVRFARVRWRGMLPEHTSAVPLDEPQPPSHHTSGGGGGHATTSSSQQQSLRREPGFRRVWCRGRAHELTLQSVATRISSVELEADALCTEILNVHELRHEPLRSARSDVRLCQSLNQIWRDENARRAAIGLGRLEDQATGATPHSAAAKRNVLPPLPRRLNAELKAIDNLLARPPVAQTPLPPSQGESSQQSQDLLCQPASQNSEEMAAAAAAAAVAR